MNLRNALLLSTSLMGLLAFAQRATAAPEVCGDGLDNDADGYADNGCYPVGVTGVCESPLSCSQTGAVAPITGQLVYHEPPDLAPTVPFGPSIAFQRTYMSKYDPGYNDPAVTDYTAPLGYGWTHNFLSWIKIDSGAADEVMVHAVTGQDILFTRVSTTGGYDTYAPQAGFHFDYLRLNQSSPFEWELRTLSGQVYKYESAEPVAKLKGILDSVGNEVTITYHSNDPAQCYDGQIEKITDASGNKYLEFAYTSEGTDCLLDTVKYYAAATLRVTANYDYDGTETYELVGVDIGADTDVRKYVYDSGHKLTAIDVEDGADTGTDDDHIAKFYYLSSNAGKVARIETGRGTIGYDYGMQLKDCIRSGTVTTTGTCVAYHRADSTDVCDADGDCDSGELCGGETDPSSADTGICFRATRWLDVSSANEDLIDAVTGSCATCTDVATYDWDTGTGGDDLKLKGLQSPEDGFAADVWTSYERNSDGLVITMIENDNDSDATNTNPSGSRATFYSYGDTSYPGLVTEVRRLSELKPSGTCTSSVVTDCKRSIYAYTTDGLLDTLQEKGFTYDSVAAVVSYDFTTNWDYDSNGRVTKYNGPRPDTSTPYMHDHIDYTYHSSIDKLLDGYRNEVKRQKASATFITTTTTKYHFWGEPTDAKDPNGDYTCLSYDADRNVVTKRRLAMNAQTSCATVDAADLTTEFTYDETLRLTQLKRPLGNCL